MDFKTNLKQNSAKVNVFNNLSSADKEINRVFVDTANKIYNRRVELGISQAEFAKRLHIKQPMVSKWESSDYNFTLKTLVEVFDALGCKINLTVTPTPLGYAPPIHFDQYAPQKKVLSSGFYDEQMGAA